MGGNFVSIHSQWQLVRLPYRPDQAYHCVEIGVIINFDACCGSEEESGVRRTAHREQPIGDGERRRIVGPDQPAGSETAPRRAAPQNGGPPPHTDVQLSTAGRRSVASAPPPAMVKLIEFFCNS